MRIAALLAGLAVAATACGGSSSSSTSTSPTVADTYICCQIGPTTVHAGQTMRLVWLFSRGPTRRPIPHPEVTLEVILKGPGRAVVARARPIHPSKVFDTPPGTSVLVIPPGTAPGVYRLISRSFDSWGSFSNTLQVRITD